MKANLLVLVLLLLWVQISFGQLARIDSLRQALARLNRQPVGLATDTLRCQTLTAVMMAYVDRDTDSALAYNSRLIQLCHKLTLRNKLIFAYQYAGRLYELRGEHYRSIDYNYKALALAETLNSPGQMAISFGSLAHAHNSLKEFAKAEKLCRQGLALLQNHRDITIPTQLLLLNVQQITYRETGRLAAALRVCQAMNKLCQTNQYPFQEANSLQAIAQVYEAQGNLAQALAHDQKALSLSYKIGNVALLGNILLNTSRLYVRQQRWKQAVRCCNQARQMGQQAQNSGLVVEADEKLYQIFRQTNQPAKALTAYERFVLLKDSLSKDRNQQRLEALQAQYTNAQNENALQRQQVQLLAEQNQNQQLAQTRNGLLGGLAAILLVVTLLVWNNRRLQAQNRRIDRQRALLETARKQLADSNITLETSVAERTAALVAANQELIRKNEDIKNALFKGQSIERKRVALELHDNLSSLLSAVNMSIQALNPQHLLPAEQSVYRTLKQLIQNAYAEVRNISHNILPAELDRDGLAVTLVTLVERLNQNLPLTFVLAMTDLEERLPVEIEFNVYSIVLELVNNAIKHAQATTVHISLARTETDIDLSVSDNGIGLGQSPGKRGVGLQNIQTRLDSLGGVFQTLQPAEPGTRVYIKIPIDTIWVDGDMAIG